MTNFNEANSVRDFVRDIAIENGWVFIPGKNLKRLNSESFIENSLKSALISNNPCIEEDISRADEVIYQLQSVICERGIFILAKV
jgi:type I restriction enzyme R subunit